jgi:hypothetical protein
MNARENAEQRSDGAESMRAIYWTSMIGFLGVVAVCISYIISPWAAAMPVAPLDLDAAMKGAISGADRMRFIGIFGIAVDALTAAACLLIAVNRMGRGFGKSALGWSLVGLSSLFFLTIDTIAGAVLSPLAATGNADAFLAIKLFFDKIFIAGTFTLALGAIFAASPGTDMPQLFRWPIIGVGVLGVTSCAAGFFGANAALPMGLSITLIAVLFSGLSAHLARSVPHVTVGG